MPCGIQSQSVFLAGCHKTQLNLAKEDVFFEKHYFTVCSNCLLDVWNTWPQTEQSVTVVNPGILLASERGTPVSES